MTPEEVPGGPFVSDILAQPTSLRCLLEQPMEVSLGSGSEAMGRFDRIVLTGMGASLAAVEPSWLRLLRRGLPAWHVNSARLVQDTPQLLTPATLVIAASQSGRSAELPSLLEVLDAAGATLVAITNDRQSPLARRADQILEIHAGLENAVSTRTYLNTIVVAIRLTDLLLDEDNASSLDRVADAIESHLASWSEEVATIKERVGLPERLYLLGRGSSVAAAEYGALILKEAAKWPVEALNTAQFRHGPLELADQRLTVLVFSGSSPAERDRNLRLVDDVGRLGGRAMSVEPGAGSRNVLSVPPADGEATPVAEAIPMQLLSVAIAELQGLAPGEFRHLDKVTTIE